jgi:hypothetical protein
MHTAALPEAVPVPAPRRGLRSRAARFRRTAAALLLPLAGLLALAGGVPAAAEESLRCGNDFVRVGTRRQDVETRCGAPDRRVRVRTADGEEEHWTYRTAWSQFPRVLVFRNGVLARIERLDSGGDV